VLPGAPYPLGATWDGRGVNFGLFSEHATSVELCLFDSPEASVECRRVPLTEQTDMVWHADAPDLVEENIALVHPAGEDLSEVRAVAAVVELAEIHSGGHSLEIRRVLPQSASRVS
jgi:pullulanase/glycogen debranching enzyme